MSSREEQVLERQRQMADRIAGIKRPPPSLSSQPSGTVASKPPPPPPASSDGRKSNSVVGGVGRDRNLKGTKLLGNRSLASLLGGKEGAKGRDSRSANGPGNPSSSHSIDNVSDGSQPRHDNNNNNKNSNDKNSNAEDQRSILQSQARRKKLDEVFLNARSATDPVSKRPSAAHKRPRTARSSRTGGEGAAAPTAAEEALARARQRVGVGDSGVADTALEPSGKSGTVAADEDRRVEDASENARGIKWKRAPMRGAAFPNDTGAIARANHLSATSSSFVGGGSLSNLLRSNTQTAKYLGPNAPKLLRHYDKIEPNDYWKNMREWNFLEDLNERMSNNNNNNKNDNHNNSGKRNRDNTKNNSDNNNHQNKPPDKSRPTATTTTLPDTFQSYRQYCALWAPLCLEEARAQLMSEAIADIPYWRSKPDKSPVRVQLQPMKKDLEGTSENMAVVVKKILGSSAVSSGGGGGFGKAGVEKGKSSFIANDVILLVKEEAFIWAATKGNLNKSKNNTAGDEPPASSVKTIFGLIGQVEHTRRSLEGLVLQVSRALWTQIGTQEMVLLKIGCNITALREFTALCRMDQIPLLDYILGEKMTRGDGKNGSEELSSKNVTKIVEENVDDIDPLKKEHQAKKQILANMGGDSALGKGFGDFARRKFNLSQLTAIAASAKDYGGGGFTLIKGPPGTGKTTTLCALLNALHIRQMNQYFQEVKVLAESLDAVVGKRAALSLANAAKKRPRILVCAPSNAAVDNVLLKIMEDGFVDGNGCRYNPSIVRVGVGQSAAVKDVCLEEKVESYISDAMDVAKLDITIEGYKAECRRIHTDIVKLRQRMNAIKTAAPYPLAKDWEIRVDEQALDGIPRVYFVNHKDKSTTYEVPPPPEPGERHFPARAMPEYKAFVSKVVKMTERYNGIATKLERYSLCRNAAAATAQGGSNVQAINNIRQQLETHILDSVHIVTTTLGTAGNRALEAANKFEVVVIDEAAQSVEPSTLAGLQLGSKHAILVGDPQQLPATIFSVSGRNTKYDRSLFQRLEEAGHDVHMLDTQYRMHPQISDFPRRIFYDGKLMDGPNVKHPEYGNPLKKAIFKKFQAFQPLTVFDLESSEERGGTSLSNPAEAQLALHLFNNLKNGTDGLSTKTRVAVITPYSQQAGLLRRTFHNGIGPEYERFVEVNTVDAFQGREAQIVIFSCVRAAGSRGIGFLSDVRRMNVALTRAKNFMFIIANCHSIMVNPYWRDLVDHAWEAESIIKVPFTGSRKTFTFPDLSTLKAETPQPDNVDMVTPACTKKPKIDNSLPGSESKQSFQDALGALNAHARSLSKKPPPN